MAQITEWMFWVCCIGIAIFDIRNLQIHKVFLHTLCILAIIRIFIDVSDDTVSRKDVFVQLGVSCMIGGMFILLRKLVHEQLGMGDIKLMVILAVYKGVENIVISFIHAFVICSIFAAIGLLLKKLNKTDKLPFAPFLVGGMMITTLLYG